MSLEIERKFLIEPLYPSQSPLLDAKVSHIEQVYLINSDGLVERVRARTKDGVTTFTHTAKKTLSQGVNEEVEFEVDEEGYAELLTRRDPARVPVLKNRYLVPRGGLTFEIDEFLSPRVFWMMEVELSSEGELEDELSFPEGVIVNIEVTGDEAYGNHSLALPAS
jgi:CYTH domain-containing protein